MKGIRRLLSKIYVTRDALEDMVIVRWTLIYSEMRKYFYAMSCCIVKVDDKGIL